MRIPSIIRNKGIRGEPGTGLGNRSGNLRGSWGTGIRAKTIKRDPGGTGIRARFHNQGSREIRDPTFRSLVPPPDLETSEFLMEKRVSE